MAQQKRGTAPRKGRTPSQKGRPAARKGRAAPQTLKERTTAEQRAFAVFDQQIDPVGCGNPCSRCSDVLVNDTTETIAAHNASVTGFQRRSSRPDCLGWPEGQRAMWPVPVVVIDERV
jgi:hypothetical protein